MDVDSLRACLALDITTPVKLAVTPLLDHCLVRVVPGIHKHEHDQSIGMSRDAYQLFLRIHPLHSRISCFLIVINKSNSK